MYERTGLNYWKEGGIPFSDSVNFGLAYSKSSYCGNVVSAANNDTLLFHFTKITWKAADGQIYVVCNVYF